MLSEHIDGRLGDAARARLEAHLRACSVCQEEPDSLRATVQILHRLPEVSVPRSFRLQSAPAPRREPRPLPLRPMQLSTAGAALLLAVLVVGDFAGAFPTSAPSPEVASPRGPQGPAGPAGLPGPARPPAMGTPTPAPVAATGASQERETASFDTAEAETAEVATDSDEKAVVQPAAELPEPRRSAVAIVLLALKVTLGTVVILLAAVTGYLWRRRRWQEA